MSNPIIQLQNKANHEEITDPVQIDVSCDSQFLTTLLNTLLSRESKYVFYYKSERLARNLDYIIEKYGLDIENVILISYIDEEDMKCDFIKECDDTVIGMRWFQNSLFYVTYGGLVFSLKDTFSCPLVGIKGLFSGARLFGFSDHSVYDIESHQEIYRFDEEIRSCSASDDGLVAVATDNKVFLLDTTHATSGDRKEDATVPTVEFPRSVQLNGREVCWAEGYNRVSVYSKGVKRSFDCNGSINNLQTHGSTIFATTANNKIIVISGDNTIEKEIPSRLSNCIRLVDNVILYSTQHDVIGLHPDSLQEVSFIKVDGQINGIAASDEMVYVANDQRISGFSKHRLVKSFI